MDAVADPTAIPDARTESREAFRRATLESVSPYYVPLAHLCGPSAVGFALITACAWLLRDVRAWQLLALPLSFVVLNRGEWHIHKYLLHRRTRFFEILYDRHTPMHHRIFITEDMAIRSPREFRLVLIPGFGVVLAFLSTLAPAAALFVLGWRNIACLWTMTAVGYVMSYEWLHLAYHLPATSFVGGLALVRVLRRHHAVHHHPALMQKWNFNVTIPLWDWVRGTIFRGTPPA